MVVLLTCVLCAVIELEFHFCAVVCKLFTAVRHRVNVVVSNSIVSGCVLLRWRTW